MKRVILIAFLFLPFFTSFASGRTIYVDDDGPADFNNIQAAINAANGGDTVSVADGIYTGDGNRDIDFLGKAITVCSQNGPQSCTIDCNRQNRGFYFHSGEYKNSVLNGFTIMNGYASNGGGIYCDYYSSPTIANCTIVGNIAASSGGGIYCVSAGPPITNCIIGCNKAAVSGGGIYSKSSTLGVTNCTFASNISAKGNALAVSGGSNNINSCILWDNGNEIYGSYTAVTYSDVSGGWVGEGNIDADPMFTRNPNDGGDGWGVGDNDDFGDLHLQPGSPCINAGNPYFFAGNKTDIDGQPRIMGQRVDMGVDEFLIGTIIITSPQAGEILAAGSSHEVTWLSDVYEGTVNILFSKDGGGSWRTIESGVPDTGSYLWHLPDIVDSNQCLIKVVPTIPDANVVCIKSGLFTIRPDSPDPVVTSKWISLGGDFRRTGLSQNYGPEFGCVKWQFETERAVPTSVTIGFDDRVHIACEDGKLYTLDANGVLLWCYDANSPLTCSPTIGPDGTIYIGSQNGSLYAIDINGRLRWTHKTGGSIYSSPAVSEDGKIYVGSEDGNLYALARDGSELWTFQTKGPAQLPVGSIFASPAICADGTVYIAGLYDPNLYALDPNDGGIKWVCSSKSKTAWSYASPVIAENGTIYQTMLFDPNLYAIEPNNGTIIWATHLNSFCDFAEEYFELYNELPPDELIKQNCNYWFGLIGIPDYKDKYKNYLLNKQYKYSDGWSEPVLGPDGTIYINFDDPYLRAVEPNGSIKWVVPLGTTGGFTLTVGSNGLIYAAGDDGCLSVVDQNGWEIARFESNSWLNYPVIARDNVIILTDANDTSLLITHTNNTVWAISRKGCRDLNFDGTVDFSDVALLAEYWLECTDVNWPCNYQGEQSYLTADVDADKYVRFSDLALIANLWHGSEKLLKPSLPPAPASNPSPNPRNGSRVWPTYLSWTAGFSAVSHNVHFGTTNPPPFVGSQTATTFDVGPLAHKTTYYWRIDEVNPMGTTTGAIWRFTTY
jgi:outer membrane protein assembly factor BamB